MKIDRMLLQWVFGIMFLAWILFTDAKFSQLQNVFNIIGLFLLFIGIIGRIYSTLYIGGMKNSGNDGNSFVSDGIYSISRNPLYFFSFIGLLGLLFLKGQILLVLIGGIVFLIIYRFTILGEEKFLSDKFGESYKKFLRTTPRFFPDYSKFRYQDRLEIRPFYLHKEMKRAFVWILGALVIYFISYLQSFEVLPVVLSVY